ncbi:hypothetical protein [Parasitella parasitica]|uniref:Uncharacterized protein n=1 Tax=Parasitella parasitica TaxID=35722 RepID=A0A0B7NQD9_9FUNG|nr:hypothetical protein [Parasitella parasitica]
MFNNSYLNGSDADDNAIADAHGLQNSDVSLHLQPNVSSSGTYQRNEKHALYVDDYDRTTDADDNPPSYSSATTQASVDPFNSVEGIPLDPYHAQPSTEELEETAPLMSAETEDEHTTTTIPQPSAPFVNQIDIVSPYNTVDTVDNKSKRVRPCSLTRVLLGLAIFTFGITLMATALATIKCYSHCREEDRCKHCEEKLHNGFMAAGFSFFILTSLCIIWKVIKFAVF